MTDTDFRLILEKLDKFEQKLKELEADIKSLKPTPVSVRYDITMERKDE